MGSPTVTRLIGATITETSSTTTICDVSADGRFCIDIPNEKLSTGQAKKTEEKTEEKADKPTVTIEKTDSQKLADITQTREYIPFSGLYGAGTKE